MASLVNLQPVSIKGKRKYNTVLQRRKTKISKSSNEFLCFEENEVPGDTCTFTSIFAVNDCFFPIVVSTLNKFYNVLRTSFPFFFLIDYKVKQLSTSKMQMLVWRTPSKNEENIEWQSKTFSPRSCS